VKKQEEHFLVMDVAGVRVAAKEVEVKFAGLVLVVGPVVADDANGLGDLGTGSVDGCVIEMDLVVVAVLRDRMVAETCEQRATSDCAAAGAATGLAVVVSAVEVAVVVKIVVVAAESPAVVEADLVAVEEAVDVVEDVFAVATALEVVVGLDVDAEEVDLVAGIEEEDLAADTEGLAAGFVNVGLVEIGGEKPVVVVAAPAAVEWALGQVASAKVAMMADYTQVCTAVGR
jgi:hypothetical protein